ncbi:hypothetical protein Cni_G14273 [Canna indica]|uniref:Ubiquitin-like domain-containing protein n=1 Tax=Canna indica TaxID=4628 RepID=A0AAQ3KBE1_9LILI|nr:hypothetical protein Cni_G14273 [Canna indica]
MYIRVKRNKTTYFVQCDPTDTTSDIKQKLQRLIDQPSNNQRLTLVSSNDILEDSKTLAEQGVENDAVVALTLRKGLMFQFELLNLSRSHVPVGNGPSSPLQLPLLPTTPSSFIAGNHSTYPPLIPSLPLLPLLIILHPLSATPTLPPC